MNERKDRLSDKVAIITGAASGIGEAAAYLFAKEGARTMLADVSERRLNKVLEKAKTWQPDVAERVTNVAEEEEVKSLIEETLEQFGQIDILCNNAGITGKYENSDVPDQETEDWLGVYKVNVMGAVYALKHVAAHMRERKSGSIVNTASVAGLLSGAGPSAYSASKAALINLTRTSACDLGGDNIRVNAICPGLIETGMTKPVFDLARQAGKGDKLGKFCELRRYGLPEEVAQAILFLASDEASFITGQALAVDGGKTATLNLPGRKL